MTWTGRRIDQRKRDEWSHYRRGCSADLAAWVRLARAVKDEDDSGWLCSNAVLSDLLYAHI
jgi:hypothetical protein